MGWLEGLLTGYANEQDSIRKDEAERAEKQATREADVMKLLLNSPRRDFRTMAATGLLTNSQGKKRKSGFGGWMGEMEANPIYPKLMKYIDEGHQAYGDAPGTSSTPPPTSAPQTALPQQPKAQPPLAQSTTSPTQGAPMATPQPVPPAVPPPPPAPPYNIAAATAPPPPRPPTFFNDPGFTELPPGLTPNMNADPGMVQPASAFGGRDGDIDPGFSEVPPGLVPPGPPAASPAQSAPPPPAEPPPAGEEAQIQAPVEGAPLSFTAPDETVTAPMPQPPPAPPQQVAQARPGRYQNIFPSSEDTAEAVARGKARGDVQGDIEQYTEMFLQADPTLTPEQAHQKAAAFYQAEHQRAQQATTARGPVIPDANSPTGYSQQIWDRRDGSVINTIPAPPPGASTGRAANLHEEIAHQLYARPGEDPKTTYARVTAGPEGQEAMKNILTRSQFYIADRPLDNQQKFGDIGKLQNDWETYAKPYTTMKQQMIRMRDAWAQAQKDPNFIPSASEQIIVTYEKMLDPNSVVRESEARRPGAMQGVLDRARGWVQAWRSGGAGIPIDKLKYYLDLSENILQENEAIMQQERARIMATAQRFDLGDLNLIGFQPLPPPGGGPPPPLTYNTPTTTAPPPNAAPAATAAPGAAPGPPPTATPGRARYGKDSRGRTTIIYP